MGKCQRLTISRSERFLGSHNQSIDHHVEGENAVDLELMEEDVWSVTEPDEPIEESTWTACYFQASGGERRGNSGLTTNGDKRTKRHVATSAPVKVPDWSKILKVDSMPNIDSDVTSGDLESEMVPPHEYLARNRNGVGGSSVFLGVGRTLKGRDMRRVRDTVWSQTGFCG